MKRADPTFPRSKGRGSIEADVTPLVFLWQVGLTWKNHKKRLVHGISTIFLHEV
jgi:hypothetical protein